RPFSRAPCLSFMDWDLPEGEPQADADLMRGKAIVGSLDAGRSRCSACGVPAMHVSTIDIRIAVAEIELHPRGNIVSHTRHERISEAPIRFAGMRCSGISSASDAAAQIAALEVVPAQIGIADARTDIGRKADDGAKVHIGVGQSRISGEVTGRVPAAIGW